MQILSFLLLTSLTVTVSGQFGVLDERWENFKKENNRHYKTAEVESYRRGLWGDKIKEIEQHNREEQIGIHSYTMKETPWDDMTYEEFMQRGGGYDVNEMSRVKRASRNGTGDCFNEKAWKDSFPYNFTSVSGLPTNVDWSQKGYVTRVKDEKTCGLCWAFAAVGSIEGQWYRKSGKLVSLSAQFLLDCSRSNYGCHTGLPSEAFNDIIAMKGVPTERKYPYTGKNSTCQKFTIAASITGYKDINTRDELQNAVAYIGPLTVGIKTGPKIQSVGNGVFTDCTGPINHGVLVVGYGIYKGQKVWKIKNSWGTSWGDTGYFYMKRGGSSDCGIYSYASYPTVDGTSRGSGWEGEVSNLDGETGGSVNCEVSLSVIAMSVCLALGVLKAN